MTPHGEPPTHLTFAGLGALGLPHATTTRHCPGVLQTSATTAPFAPAGVAALRPAGLDLARIAWARQIHGAAVAEAPPGGGFAGSADVLVTTQRGVPLAIVTADCLAVTLYDRGAGALALAHVGWRGTARGAAGAAVEALRALGGRPERADAAVAPSIGPCCYEVDAPVVGALSAAHPALWERWVTPARAGHWMLDLWAANEALLARAGVDPARIENPRLCTGCHGDLLFSHRKGHRGRLVTVAALP